MLCPGAGEKGEKMKFLHASGACGEEQEQLSEERHVFKQRGEGNFRYERACELPEVSLTLHCIPNM